MGYVEATKTEKTWLGLNIELLAILDLSISLNCCKKQTFVPKIVSYLINYVLDVISTNLRQLSYLTNNNCLLDKLSFSPIGIKM